MKHKNKWIILAGLSAFLVALGCGKKEEASAPKKTPTLVRTITVERGSIVEQLETTGEVVAVNTVELKATVEGPIAFCPWREGDKVEQKGQKIIEIDRPLYRQELQAAQAALSVAEAKLADLKAGARPEEIKQAAEKVKHLEDCTAFAQADLERIRSLVKSGSLPGEAAEKARVAFTKCHSDLAGAKEQLAMLKEGPTRTEIAVAEAAVEEARAKLGLAQAKLEECVLTAPFAGIVTRVDVRAGDLATPRTPLLKMMDPDSLVVRFAIPEARASDLKEGAQAEIQLDAVPEKTFAAETVRIYPQLQRNTRTRLAEAKIVDKHPLLPGEFARVAVAIRQSGQALVVPDKAVLATPRGERMLFVVDEKNVARRRILTTGIEQGRQLEVLEGLKSGEQVVVEGNEKLRDGMTVKVDAIVKAAVKGGDEK